jgi:CheY-like chemotaxis protein
LLVERGVAMERVLVVEKNGKAVRPIVGVASDIGVGVDFCEETDDALTRLRSCRYSSVFLDIDTTGLDPIEVVGAIKEASPGTSIVTLTAKNHLDLERGIRAEGVYYYIVGPPSDNELREALEGAVRAGKNDRY